ncbi:hypothetical protein AWH56_009190 [Anaerobacillus isosaccharinicus]|uniref:Uncharacterized protein n=1 Tax=Anaerobacillus isosaccharinicus TaxID=1532552 RepID=A0A7S7LB92_9BACI|nr:hypothetical protein [Anaerobacillus isosaccharinicus]MBA5588878.1 hypothetical protein [Anaerobacillus isosaccharinicus]QOY37735.1 hypothetical protein AWH56_009190 [Anaerobacillus isosaccharinicus]
MIADLSCQQERYEGIKNEHGKLIAKYKRFLTKEQYVLQKELKIRSILLQLQIELM